MNQDLNLVSQVIYLHEGIVELGDEAKVERLEQKILDWKHDVEDDDGKKSSPKEDMAAEMSKVENCLEGYWCKGEKCVSTCSHWVLHSSETICWDCRHDPCACSPPLVWDDAEYAWYRFFLSCDGKIKKNIWMSEPTSDLATISFKRKEKQTKDTIAAEREEEECADNQQHAQDAGFCCHHHAKRMNENDEKERQVKKQAKVDGPDHCIHCDEDSCVFVQIGARLCENDTIYYDNDDYAKDPAACNSGRRKQAYQYTAFMLWEGINYRRPHYTCVWKEVFVLYSLPLTARSWGTRTNEAFTR
jgi:hypothetical protein